MSIWEFFIVALGGGSTVKLIEFLVGIWRRRAVRKEEIEKSVDKQLDYILKTADDLYSKLRASAQRDFIQSKHDIESSISSLAFLLAVFWGQMEVFRDKALFVELSKDERGQHIKQFLTTLYSSQIRLLPRMAQRAVGELTLEHKRYIDVSREFDDKGELTDWFSPLLEVVQTASENKTSRQRLLRYGVVVHAMIDTLDPEHHVTKELPAYANKLSKHSIRDLRYKTFRNHLPFVKNWSKYLSK